MATIYKISRRNKIGVWIIFGLIFLYWGFLFLTSENAFTLFDWLLLALVCFAMPSVMTFFVFVTIDDDKLTVPMLAFFRKSIRIKNIKILHFRPHGLGFMKGIVIEYVNDDRLTKKALLPSLTTFGRIKTSQMIQELTEINPSIKVDSEITKLISK